MSNDLPETRLVPSCGVQPTGAPAQAAAAVADLGGSPRAQIEAARIEQRKINPRIRIGYVSHQGKRQRERALRRLAQSGGIGGSSHDLPATDVPEPSGGN